MTVREQCGTQNSVQHCRVACTVARTAVVGGKQNLRFGFVFYTEKSSTPSVLKDFVGEKGDEKDLQKV